MGTEIERKFLVTDTSWKEQARTSKSIRQGYLANTERGSIRIRIHGDAASLNVKSMTLGVTRSEYDYPIPLEDARSMLEHLCMKPLIEKTRFLVPHEGREWEIDEFHGDNAGLVVAEIELESSDAEFPKPAWLGPEVSDDPRYYNVCLVEHPYSKWAG